MIFDLSTEDTFVRAWQAGGMSAAAFCRLHDLPCHLVQLWRKRLAGSSQQRDFGFTNKRKDRVRLLYWDGTGLWLMTKRLEKGTFAWPQTPQPAAAFTSASTSTAD